MHVLWLIIACAVIGVIIVARLYFTVRKLRPSHQESWDEKMIESLRSKGYAPFNQYPVDFFLALPNDAACNAVRERLEPEGFTVDVRPIEDEVTLPLSLHATKTMRLILLDMVELSKRMSELAAEQQGRYDGWAA
ncbi:MAG TPA: ribonuclease E inhibitor RraB [Steroidobacteraceae bacterium]|nr:ribonuclease E inhibitor RraB [Steroidobacteraceae bacterium]